MIKNTPIGFFRKTRLNRLANSKSRYLEPFEALLIYDEDSTEVKAKIFAARKVMRLEFTIESTEAADIQAIYFDGIDVSESIPFETAYEKNQDIQSYALLLHKPSTVSEIGLKLFPVPTSFKYELNLLLVDESESDYLLLKNAFTCFTKDRINPATRVLTSYLENCQENPHAHALHSNICYKTERYTESRESAFAAIDRGLYEGGEFLYRRAAGKINIRDKSWVEGRVKACQGWQLPPHTGVVVLERTQSYEFGVDQAFVRRVIEVLQVKRSAAARMFRSLNFIYDAGREILLSTRVTIYRPGTEPEQLSLEMFSIRDDNSNNAFIAKDAKKLGHWIMPDLEPGHVILLEYDICGFRPKGDKAERFFDLTAMYRTQLPHLRTAIEFGFHSDQQLDFRTLNWPEQNLDDVVGEKTDGRSLFVLTKYTPHSSMGFPYEDTLLNSHVAICELNRSWKDVATRAFADIAGNTQKTDNLPSCLKSIIDDDDRPRMALSQVFYWIRDKLKYASLDMTNKNVHLEGRAAKIIELGLADCKDRAHLLGLACRELNIPYEFVVTNLERGVVVEDMPAHQFDHIFIRVRLDGEWKYLDPTSTESVFSCTPYISQGLKALVLDKPGSIVTIPEDTPDLSLFDVHVSVENAENDWLKILFDIRMTGHTARAADELWKSLSMTFHHERRSKQEFVRQFLNSATVESIEKISDTGNSDVFHVSGEAKGCRLVQMGQQSRLGILDWNLPFLPISFWRSLDFDQLFVFKYPCRIRMITTIGPNLSHHLSRVSTVKEIDNRICKVAVSQSSTDNVLAFSRRIDIRRKMIRGADSSLLHETFESIEGALRMVISLNDVSEGRHE